MSARALTDAGTREQKHIDHSEGAVNTPASFRSQPDKPQLLYTVIDQASLIIFSTLHMGIQSASHRNNQNLFFKKKQNKAVYNCFLLFG